MTDTHTDTAPAETKGPSRVTLWAALIIAFLGWMFDGMEMGLYSWAARPAIAELIPGADNATIGRYLGYTLALFLSGMSLGGIIFGRLGDRIGRVKTMMITVLVYAIFTGLSGLSHSFTQLAACRFIGAMGLGGEWGLGVALVVETWPNTSRPMLAGLLGGAANVGFLIAAGVTAWLSAYQGPLPLESWRIALMIGFVPALLTFGIRLFVKESERWVQSQKRGERSRASDLFSGPLLRQSLVGVAVSAVAVLGMWGAYQAWLQFWVNDMVGASPAYAGAAAEVVKQAQAAARANVSLWMAVGSIFGSLLGGPAAEWLGRRRSYALMCAGAAISTWLLYLTCDSYGPKLLLLSTVGGVFAAGLFGWLPLYLPELFPTRIRATGEGLTFNAGRILSAGGVLVMGQLVQSFGGYPKAASMVAGIWVLGMVLIWFAPETKGCELPD